jgi:CheY-like chemotaxis protein
MFLDVSMAGIRGLGVLEELQARGLDLAVIVAVDYVEDSSWGSGGSGAIFSRTSSSRGSQIPCGYTKESGIERRQKPRAA